MIIPFESVENKPTKWYKNPAFWILIIAFKLIFLIIIFTTILLLNKHGSSIDFPVFLLLKFLI